MKGSKIVVDKIMKGTIKVYEAWKLLLATGIPPLTLFNCKKNGIDNYKIYGNSIQSELSTDYQQVEYIESTGTQYFEIDYIANQSTNSKGKFQITDTSKANFLFGARRGAAQGECYGFNWGGGVPYKYYNTYYGNSNDGMTNIAIDANIHTFEKKINQLYLDDTLIHTRKDTDGTIEFTTPNNILVFGCNTNGTKGLLTYARIFNLQLYDYDVLKINLIPCYRKADNVIGMYDSVNNVFYTNQGTGTFLKGNDVDTTDISAINVSPTPENPIDIKSVGEYDKTTGKYKIPVKVNDTITNIYLNEPLRKSGNYADYVDFKNQKIVRLVESIVFNGSENWEKHTNITGGSVFRLDNVINPKFGEYVKNTFMTHFQPTEIYTTSEFTPGLYRFTNAKDTALINGTRLYISTVHTTVEELKEWLSENKPELVYFISEEIPNDIELPTIQTNRGTNVVEVDTKLLPSNLEINYYSK